MAIISEKQISQISKKLGESEFFIDARKSLLDILPKEGKSIFSYGLGIAVDGGEFFSGVRTKKPTYTFDIKGDAKNFNWGDGEVDKKYLDNIQEGFIEAQKSFVKSDVAAYCVASFSEGNIIVCPSDKKSEVSFSTDLEGSNDIVFVIAESNANLTVFDTVLSSNDSGGRTVIVLAKRNAVVKYIQTHDSEKSLYNNVIFFARRDSQVSYTGLSLSEEALIKTDVEQYLNGQGAVSKIQNISFSSGKGVVDMNSVVHHRASNTTSYLQGSGVATGKSKIIYRSDIHMEKDTCSSVVGNQKAKFLILSPKAEVDAIPALNIAQKEVQCSHSVSISHVKDSDLYYPKLRGMNEKQASRMIVEGMLQFGIQDINQESYLNALQEKIQDTLVKIDF